MGLFWKAKKKLCLITEEIQYLDTFLIFPITLFTLFSLSLREKAQYRVKDCLIGPLYPKQPTKEANSNTLASLD